MSEMVGGSADPAQLQEQLARDGYCVMPQILGTAALASLRGRFSDRALSNAPHENFGDAGAFIVADYHDPVLVDLLTLPKILDTLDQLGYPEPKLHNYYVSTKPPGTEALPWHSDLFYDYDKAEPAELFLIYYLQDTNPDNGCLRVVPGSHLWTRQERESQPKDAEMRLDEADVCIRAGELFIGDRRILHATHPNDSETWRTCLTIAYAPAFAKLPDSVKDMIVQNQCLPPRDWPNDPDNGIDPRLQAILPVYAVE